MSEHDPLKEELDRLPREMEPARDLWPGIETRIVNAEAEDPTKVTPLRTAWREWSRQILAAAAVVVVFLAGWGVATLRTPGKPAGDGRVAPPLAATDEAVADYEAAERTLLETLENSGIEPETAALIRRDLAAMDLAVTDIRTALENHPDDPRLQKQLANEMTRRQRVLRRIAGIQIAGLQLGGEE